MQFRSSVAFSAVALSHVVYQTSSNRVQKRRRRKLSELSLFDKMQKNILYFSFTSYAFLRFRTRRFRTQRFFQSNAFKHLIVFKLFLLFSLLVLHIEMNWVSMTERICKSTKLMYASTMFLLRELLSKPLLAFVCNKKEKKIDSLLFFFFFRAAFIFCYYEGILLRCLT